MVKKFTGQVKASDIQEEFDSFTEEINRLIDIYNASIDTSDIDFTTGSSSLGAYNYTLTVGGLKTILRACDGTVIGCRPFKDGNTLIITEGIIITENAVYRVPYHVVNNYTDLLILYNPTTGQWTSNSNYTFPEGYYRIAETEMRREYCPDVWSFRGAQLEGTGFRIKVRDRWAPLGPYDGGGTENWNTGDRPIFLSPGEKMAPDEGASARMWNDEILFSQASFDSRRACNWWRNVTFVYLPKGCPNPFSYYTGGKRRDHEGHQFIFEVDKQVTHKRN